MANVGRTISQGSLPQLNSMSPAHALWLQTTSRGLSRLAYQRMRMSFLDRGLGRFPGWNSTKEYRDQVSQKYVICMYYQ